MRKNKGVTLIEMVVAVAIFAIVATIVVTLFTVSRDYYASEAAQADTESFSQQAVVQMVEDVQESDPGGMHVHVNGTVHDAILLISPRNMAGRFQTSSGLPYWQKWVCYYLAPDPNGSYSMLMRKESSTLLGGTLPSSVIPTPPAGWYAQFVNATHVTTQMVASGIQTLDMEDIDCGYSKSPLYIQVIATVTQQGRSTTYNPGSVVNFRGCARTGNWAQAQVEN